MFRKILKLTILALFIWLGYQFIYITPTQKNMNQELASRELTKTFKEDFEDISTTTQLFDSSWQRWHELILQNNEGSIRRPIKYCLIIPVDCILNKTLGNYAKIDSDTRRRGKNSLKFEAQPFGKKWLGDSRIAIRKHLDDFKKGDHIYFSGWFYFEGPENPKNEELVNLNDLALVSFRSKNNSLRTYGEPGPTLYLSFRNYLGMRFDNWAPELDQVHQDLLNRIHMPLNKWVQIKWHLKLSERSQEGLAEVWIDGEKVMAERTQTLPKADMTYSIFELGVGSNLNLDHGKTLYVDNIFISPDGFENW